MSDSASSDLHFLNQLHEVIAANLSNEHFGVTELADAMNMSRSNLLRKVKKSTALPVNQLIREARLTRAMELLHNSSLNVSEVSHHVGFNSTSYFIKCFREHYGHPPGETGKRPPAAIVSEPALDEPPAVSRKKWWTLAAACIAVVIVGAGLYYYVKHRASVQMSVDRSIVVLPFKNESNDSTNVYLINGLMESTLNNLQKLEHVRVLSRTSSEKYRNTSKSILELSQELDAHYFVEGSGQKIGDQILLTIQLIEGRTDKHIWSKQYRREARDIFSLQQEVAKNIADEIEVIISPQAKQHIEKIPTENLEAYDLYLKGKDLYYQATDKSMAEAMTCFRKAIALDDRFALAYAHLVMVEYYSDIFQVQKNYSDEIGMYADKALLFDAKSGESLVAKALAYAYKKEYKSAVIYLEKALEYNPHSGLVYYFLTEFYSLFVPDPAKYLEYSLRAANEDRVTMDSATVGFRYFHVSNALIQVGFIEDAIRYVDLSMAYDPKDYFSRYVSVLYRYAMHKDVELAKTGLIREFEKDTMRVDIVKEVGKVSYIARDYATAYRYYKKFLALREQFQLEIYKEEYLSISIVFEKMGKKKEAEDLLQKYKAFVHTDEAAEYTLLLRSLYYLKVGNTKRALADLSLYAEQDTYPYWVLLLKNDPLVDPIRNLPEFKRITDKIETNFWARHKRTKADMEEKGLYPVEAYLK